MISWNRCCAEPLEVIGDTDLIGDWDAMAIQEFLVPVGDTTYRTYRKYIDKVENDGHVIFVEPNPETDNEGGDSGADSPKGACNLLNGGKRCAVIVHRRWRDSIDKVLCVTSKLVAITMVIAGIVILITSSHLPSFQNISSIECEQYDRILNHTSTLLHQHQQSVCLCGMDSNTELQHAASEEVLAYASSWFENSTTTTFKEPQNNPDGDRVLRRARLAGWANAQRLVACNAMYSTSAYTHRHYSTHVERDLDQVFLRLPSSGGFIATECKTLPEMRIRTDHCPIYQTFKFVTPVKQLGYRKKGKGSENRLEACQQNEIPSGGRKYAAHWSYQFSGNDSETC